MAKEKNTNPHSDAKNVSDHGDVKTSAGEVDAAQPSFTVHGIDFTNLQVAQDLLELHANGVATSWLSAGGSGESLSTSAEPYAPLDLSPITDKGHTSFEDLKSSLMSFQAIDKIII